MEIFWHTHVLKTNYSPKKNNDNKEKEVALIPRKLLVLFIQNDGKKRDKNISY